MVEQYCRVDSLMSYWGAVFILRVNNGKVCYVFQNLLCGAMF